MYNEYKFAFSLNDSIKLPRRLGYHKLLAFWKKTRILTEMSTSFPLALDSKRSCLKRERDGTIIRRYFVTANGPLTENS
jgi:hypothetical protein